jgi:hypothetical protein
MVIDKAELSRTLLSDMIGMDSYTNIDITPLFPGILPSRMIKKHIDLADIAK